MGLGFVLYFDDNLLRRITLLEIKEPNVMRHWANKPTYMSYRLGD